MNFKVNPIILANLVSKMEPSMSYWVSNFAFLKRLSINNPDTWTLESIGSFMVDRANLAAVIVSSPDMCNSAQFIYFLFDKVISKKDSKEKQNIAVKHFQDFMSLKNADPFTAFKQILSILMCVPLHLSILEMMKLEGLLDVSETQQKRTVDSAWEKHFARAFLENHTPACLFAEQSGWSGPAYMRSSTPESFAASPDGQRYASQQSHGQRLLSQQHAWESSLKSKTNEAYSESKVDLESLHLQALGRTVHDLTLAVQSLRAEVSQQANAERARKKEDATKMKTSTSPEVPKNKYDAQASNHVASPLMVKPKRVFIKKEPKA